MTLLHEKGFSESARDPLSSEAMATFDRTSCQDAYTEK